MVRLKDIAERAGVSAMTVSKVMRDAPDISANTKARIRLLAQEMGYLPNSLAQELRNRRSRLFGLVIPSVAHPYLSRAAMAIEERASDLGYDVLLAQSMNSPEREEICLRKLLSRRVDGLFISPVYRLDPSAPIYAEILRRGTPTVLLGHRAAFCSQFTAIETDDILGSYDLTQHLLGLGHRRIAFFAGPAGTPWAQERYEGYRRALREADIEVDDRLVFAAGMTPEDGEKAVLQMLDESTGATAVQAVNDLVAIGAMSVLQRQGLRIPQDISVTGFGNAPLSEHWNTPLTTVRQPKRRLGLAALDAMQKLLLGQRPGVQRLPTSLLVRASSGPPPG